MSIVKSISRKATSNTTPRFTIALSDSDSVEFRPTATFSHVTAEQVLKIITKGNIDVTAENNVGKVNFKISVSSGNLVKNAAFINYFDNDLDDESNAQEVNATIKDLSAKLAKVKASDITLPMTKSEADDLIDNL
jgi:hypothetical protein